MTIFRAPTRVDDGSTNEETLFALIAGDIESSGYSIRPCALPKPIADALFIHQQQMGTEKYVDAGVGRRDDFQKNAFVRTDEICWITGSSAAGHLWLGWAANLQNFLNKRLFLGLFSFESHFAHYAPGDYYKRHFDAFRGEANRALSIVVYLNSAWTNSDAGELIIYTNESDRVGTRVVPLYGTVVAFLSEEFPHEVLPAKRDRYSVAGWFRVNTSLARRVDPPL